MIRKSPEEYVGRILVSPFNEPFLVLEVGPFGNTYIILTDEGDVAELFVEYLDGLTEF